MVAVLIWLICAAATAWVYDQKGRDWKTGLLGGFVLGPIGIILAVATPPKPKS